MRHFQIIRLFIILFSRRYMMLILKQDEVYFLDRDNSVFQVEGIRFPHRKDLNRHLVNTLLDGVSANVASVEHCYNAFFLYLFI